MQDDPEYGSQGNGGQQFGFVCEGEEVRIERHEHRALVALPGLGRERGIAFSRKGVGGAAL